jgi:hypothetical protein
MHTPDQELRNRVKRLLSGDFRSEDLTRLFLYLRDRSPGSAIIQEVGDFVVHADDRKKGVVTQELRDHFDLIRSRMPYFLKPIELSSLPPAFGKTLRTNFHDMDEAEVESLTGLTHKAADAALTSAIWKLSYVNYGPASLTEAERAVIECCMSIVVSEVAFTEDALLQAFVDTLFKDELLAPEEASHAETMRPAVTLFAVAAMHKTTITLDDGSTVELHGGVNSDELIEVSASARSSTLQGKTMRHAAPVFSTTLRAAEWCDPKLLRHRHSAHWEFPIQAGPGPRLVPS